MRNLPRKATVTSSSLPSEAAAVCAADETTVKLGGTIMMSLSLDVRPNDPNVFASCSCDHSVRVWDVRVSQKHAVACLTVFPSDVNDVRWFPDSEALGAAGDLRCRGR